jgi:hypothetical protein
MAGTQSTPEPAPARDEPFLTYTALLNDLSRCWKLAVDRGARAVTGDYRLTEAISDIDSWLAGSTNLALAYAGQYLGIKEPLPPLRRGTWSATMTVFPGTPRPLTLFATDLRAFGTGGGIALPSSVVSLNPATIVDEETTTFDVTVSFDNVPAPRTLIYQGEIMARETNAPVTDPIRPNNRDDGFDPDRREQAREHP